MSNANHVHVARVRHHTTSPFCLHAHSVVRTALPFPTHIARRRGVARLSTIDHQFLDDDQERAGLQLCREKNVIHH